jgi:NAD(P)-dependent dehydrogenase (short-subunit alcohol dehydrogenase family)
VRLTYAAGAALVAGGSGGIGAAVVAALSEAGVPAGFTYRSGGDRARAVAATNEGKAPVKAYPWGGPTAEEAAGLAARVAAEVGPIRYLICCSGSAQTSAFHALSEPEWLDLIQTNLTGTIALARAVVTPMLKAGLGRIVFTGSVSGLHGISGHSIYSATKGALHAMTRSLARECSGFGVTVNCVAPGLIETPMLDGMPDRAREDLLKRIPVGRLGTPREVAHLIAFLASEQAAYITGQTLAVDGGLSA